MSPFSVLAFHRWSLPTLALMPLYGIAYGIACIKGMRYSDREGARASVWISMGYMPLFVAIALGVISLLPGHHPTLSQAAKLVAFIFLLGFLLSVPNFFVLFGLSTFVPGPLRRLIAEVVQKPGERISLLITVTEMVNSFDPDSPEVVGSARAGRVATDAVQPFPEYVNAKEMAADELLQLLLASSALPHGIFPPITRPSAQYVDGGLADNLPVYAALEGGYVDELTVICLRPTPLAKTRQSWKKADRKMRLRKIPVVEAMALRSDFLQSPKYLSGHDTRRMRPPQILPFRDPPYWPEREMLIAPAKKLGNTLTGTMNFTRCRSRQLLKPGMGGCMEDDGQS